MSPEAFGAARLRDAALAAWTQHPARFREDANTEEDHARGFYRDRVVVELAQNAADAAARAGTSGHLSLRLVTADGGGVLVAANTGTPLDDAGVASLASLRASAKRDQVGAPVGRFGVGFAAVRSVADDVTVASVSGTVHFSLDAAAAALAGPGREIGELGAELARRGPWIPVLRLPFGGPAAAHAPHVPDLAADEWDTAVVLTLRDADAVEQVRRQLDLDDSLLLALPALGRITVQIDDQPPRVIQDVADRWVVATDSGVLDAGLLADRPVEERDRTGWQVTWAVRRDGGPVAAAVVHAPTPTDEPSTLPALLIGTFPLDATRRQVASGPLTDVLVASAGRVWADLLGKCAVDGTPDPFDLLPTGLPAGGLDAALRSAALAATRTTPLLAPAGGGPLRAPEDATVLRGPLGDDRAVVATLGARWPTLVPTPRQAHAVRLLEIPAVDLSELVEGLPDMPPTQARDLYEVFGKVDTAALEDLAMLPVPLVDGRTVRGVRGLVTVEPLDAEVLVALAQWGLRIVHPDAVHPLLVRLGAEQGDAAGLLGHPVLRDRVMDGDDEEDDPSALSPAEVMLRLVQAALSGGELRPQQWWGEVLLPAHDGDLVPARGLTVFGSDAAAWFDPETLPTADPALAERWGAEVLEALGVRTSVRSVTVADDAADLGELDGWDDYREDVLADDEADELLAVADLDAVRPDAWAQVLRSLANGPGRRALAPVRLRGRPRPVPSYAAWWLRRRGGVLGAPFALADGPEHHLSQVLPPAPEMVVGLDPQVQRWLGGVGAPAELHPEGWADLLERHRVGDPVPLTLAAAAWRAIAEHVRAGETWDVEALPALVGPGRAELRPADDVAVGSPMWTQHPGALPLLVVPRDDVEPVADALDLRPAHELAPGRVTSVGEPADTPDAVLAVFPAAPETWVEHEDLRVDGEDVDWWVTGEVHAATTAGLARGLAELTGSHAGHLERLLVDPAAVAAVLLDLAGEGGQR